MRARLIVVGALLALAGAPPAHARGCARTLPHGPALPAPIVVRTVCGVFVLRRDGSVVYGRLPRWSPRWAPFATSHPDPRTWVAHPNRRLAVYRGGRLLWRARSTGGSDEVAIGHGHVAFTSYRYQQESLWIASLDGRELLVARNEQIVGWTRAGLVTQRGRGLLLRGPGGNLRRSLGPARTAVRDGSRLVVLRPDGTIVRSDGWREETLANLRVFRMARQPWLQLLTGGLIEVSSGRRVLLLDRHGRRFATADLTRLGTIVGGPLPLPRADAVVFAVVERRGDADPGVETVYRLGRGEHVPRPLFSTRLRRLTCGQGATLDYRHGRLLFASNEGRIAVLDPLGQARPNDLTGVVRRLFPRRPNPDQTLSAGWA